jgi:hypothetical protein
LEEGENAVAEIPKDGFKNREELFNWLHHRPYGKADSIFAIAVRSAHRTASFLPNLDSRKSDFPAKSLILFALRCNLVARVAIKYPSLETHAAAVEASNPSASLGVKKNFAVICSCNAPVAVVNIEWTDAYESVVAATACVDEFDSVEYYKAITADVLHLEHEESLIDILNSPLWPQGEPEFWKEADRDFQSMLATFQAGKGHWHIWAEWYHSVVQGQSAFNLPEQIAKELEIRVALGDGRKDFWNRAPELINAEISRWLSEAREQAELLPSTMHINQNTLATTFGTNARGQIDRLPIPPEQRLLDTPEQRRAYIDIRNDCISILSQGPNQLGACEVQFKTLREVMPEDFSQAAVYDLWRAVNRLRRTLNAHKSVASNIEPHPAKLEPTIAVELGGFLGEVNNFAFADPKIRERDINAIAPQDRVKLDVERALGDQLAKNALAYEGLTTPPAHHSLKDEEENAAGAHDDAHGVQAIEQSNIVRRNFNGAAIMGTIAALKSESGFAFREFRGGAYKQAGGAAMIAAGALASTNYPAVMQFVMGNIGALIDYATIYNNPGVVDFLNWVKAQIGK